MNHTPVVDRNALEASLCRDSFYDFVKRFWSCIIPEAPVWNWHIEYLCQELQTVAEQVFKGLPKLYDLIINISPGSTKSTICSVMFPAWVWSRMPSAKMICGSYRYALAMDLSRKSRDIVLSEKYQRLYGEITLREDQNTKGYFMNSAGGGRIAVGTGGGITGFHGHFIIVDDPLDPNESASEPELKTANRWMSETLPTRKVDKAVTPTILIMQRLHQDDPTGCMLEKFRPGQLRHICLPAEISEKVRPRSLRKFYKDGLMDPVRLSREVLDEALQNLGAYGYAGQFDQNPIPRGGGMFRTQELEIVPCLPNRKFRIVRYWDKAGTRKGGCFTVGVKMAEELGGARQYYLIDVVRGQWDASERTRIMHQTAEMDGREVVVGVEQEPGSGGKESAQATVRDLSGWIVRVDRPTGDKETRADTYAVQVNSGHVYLVKGAWNAEYISELKYFPDSKYKDQVDASSGAFAMLTKPVIRAGALPRKKKR